MTEHRPAWSDETLMAWADGELSDECLDALESALLTDEALADRAAQMVETRALARQAWDAELDTPVPDALRASVEAMVAQDRAQRESLGMVAQANVADEEVDSQASAFAPTALPAALGDEPPAAEAPTASAALHPEARRSASRAEAPPAGEHAPLSAPPPTRWQRLQSGWGAVPVVLLASAVCAGLGFWLGSMPSGLGARPLPSTLAMSVGQPLPPVLAQELNRAISGQRVPLAGGAELVPMASYAVSSGGLCREFSVHQPSTARVEAIACLQSDQRWQLQVAAQVAPDDSFAPAAADGLLGPALAKLGAKQSLSLDVEQTELARLRGSIDAKMH